MSTVAGVRRRRPRPPQRRWSQIPAITYGLLALVAVATVLVIWLLVVINFWFAPAGAAVTVPDLTGMSYSDAVDTARRRRLALDVIAHRSDAKAPKDSIIGQLPYAGEQVREGRAISVIVSDGAPTAVTPNLSGMTQREAAVALENVRLELGTVATRRDTSVVAGTVVAQETDPLTTLPVGSRVNVTVATGRPLRYTPSFLGLPIAVAQSAARDSGIGLDKYDMMPPAPNAPPKGIIVAQDPMPGTTLDANLKIRLQVSGGPIATPTPLPTNPAVSILPNPDAMRGIRISVKLPPENPAAEIKIVVQDGTGARTIWDQHTAGGQTLWFDLGVTGAATLETYVNDELVTASPI